MIKATFKEKSACSKFDGQFANKKFTANFTINFLRKKKINGKR